MSSNQPIRVYSQLFDESYVKDLAFYKIFFTTPIHSDALLSVLVANCESIIRHDSVMPLKIVSELFYNGLVFFNEAILYPIDEENGDLAINGSAFLSKNASGFTGNLSSLSIDGDDITDLHGKSDLSSGSTPFDDGDDITTLNGPSTSRRPSKAVSESESIKPTRQFEAIDEELRLELVTNILSILQILFNNTYESNKRFSKLRTSSDSVIPDILIKIFDASSNRIIANDFLLQLLAKLKWYLQQTIDDIQDSEDDTFLTLGVIKEIIMLIVDILKTIFFSIVYFEPGSKEHTVLKGLLHTFIEVDFSDVFQQLVDMTNGPEPKISLSADSLMIFYSIVTALANIPKSLLPDPKSSDITNVPSSANQYEQLLKTKPIDDINRLIPLYIMELDYFYQYRPDLLKEQINNGSFFLWLTKSTFSDNLYSNFESVSLDDLHHPDDNKEKRQFIEELTQILKKKIFRTSESEELEAPELLTTSLLLNSYCENPEFIEIFTKQANEVVHKIEDIDPKEISIELFEVWLCASSYIFQYQYKSVYFQYITKVVLHVLLKSIKQSVGNIKSYQMNEFRWKLSHQKHPIVPNDYNKDGFKSGLFYILDALQNLLRFNLTNRLKIENFQMAINCIYLILKEFQEDETMNLTNYNWTGLFKTLFRVLSFIRKQDLQNSKYFQKLSQIDIIRSVTEEILQTVNCLLTKRFNNVIQAEEGKDISNNDNVGSHLFKSINYDLVYNILLNFELVTNIIDEFQLSVPNLQACLDYFATKIHLTEETKESEVETTKINLIDYDFDSPFLIELINKYLLENDAEGINTNEFKFAETFSYIESDMEINEVEMIRMINVILAPKNKLLSRFFVEVNQ